MPNATSPSSPTRSFDAGGAGGAAPDTFTLERDGPVAVLTLVRAHCLDTRGKHDLTAAVAALAGDAGLRALVVTAAHPGAYLVDVAELAEMTPEAARAYSDAGHRLADALGALPVPVIAAVPGAALGGGCEFVLSCDLAYAAEGATLGQIEVNGGVIPGFGGTWRLPRRVGYQRACELIFTGAVVDARTAQAYGLVLDVVPAGGLLPHCREVAGRVAGASRDAVAAAKRVMQAGWGLPPAAADALEQAAFAARFGTDDQRGRMRAFLAQEARRPAAPSDPPPNGPAPAGAAA